VQELIRRVQECRQRIELSEDPDAKAATEQFVEHLNRQDGLYAARLQFLFTQDLYARALFSPEGRITIGAVNRAIAWTEHQLQTREALWPPDTSADPRERMYHALEAAFKKHHSLSTRKAMGFGNVHRPNSGGIVVFNQVLHSMRAAGLIEVAGKTRGGRPVWQWVGADEPQSIGAIDTPL
jgi:hypothetical protein